MSRLSVTTVPAAGDRSLSVFAEFDAIADRIRDRAFQIFTDRKPGDGNALDDWLKAERQLCWPAAEMVEEDDEFEIKVALAGFEADEISVTAAQREIIIKAAHEPDDEQEEDDEDEVILFSEFRSDPVIRRFELPADIDVEDVEAKFKNGLLKIEAPKRIKSEVKHRDIEISTAA